MPMEGGFSMPVTTGDALTALHAVARAALRYRDRTGTQGVLSEALDRLTASGWRPDGQESEEASAGLLGAGNGQPEEPR